MTQPIPPTTHPPTPRPPCNVAISHGEVKCESNKKDERKSQRERKKIQKREWRVREKTEKAKIEGEIDSDRVRKRERALFAAKDE